MKKTLNVRNRIILLSVLPEKGDFVTFRMVDELRKKLGLTAEELEKTHFISSPDPHDSSRTIQNWDNEFDTEYEFADKETELIVNTLKDLDKKKELDFINHIPLYEMFVV